MTIEGDDDTHENKKGWNVLVYWNRSVSRFIRLYHWPSNIHIFWNELVDYKGPENINYTKVRYGETFCGRRMAVTPAAICRTPAKLAVARWVYRRNFRNLHINSNTFIKKGSNKHSHNKILRKYVHQVKGKWYDKACKDRKTKSKMALLCRTHNVTDTCSALGLHTCLTLFSVINF